MKAKPGPKGEKREGGHRRTDISTVSLRALGLTEHSCLSEERVT